ncbi:MAG TPA: hypothetical protein VNO70_11985 [Blastocatellia bacterium]|nr:hypothetical protein [Blastocatellia bacterium]
MAESIALAEESNVSPEVLREAAKDLESLRLLNQVILVDDKDEGTGIAHLPNGVYGFSWAPQEESPLFRKKSFQNFEVHKAADGAVYLIGFVTAQEAALLTTAPRDIEVKLYPEPWGESVKAVSIPKSSILQAKAPSRSHGNALKLEVEPHSQPLH